MTKKLYYENSYLTNFEAEVISCEPYKEGFTVVLNETAFYPEGGGQPADEGFINEAKVSHVFIKDEVIYHVVDQALEVGSKVEGKINFERRFDFMQQHSGEHIVSGIINAKYGYNNVGFHLSSDYMTADVDGELSEAQIKEVIQIANEAVFKNVPVKATVFENDKVKDKTYRSKIELAGKVRLVEIGDYDTCACCGTHVKNAGEIGVIECINWERHRGGMRLTLLCGKRALEDYDQRLMITREIGNTLSTKTEKILEAFMKQQEELNNLKQKVASVTNDLLIFRAQDYIAKGETCIMQEGLSGDELRKLCVLMAELGNKVYLVLTQQDGSIKYALGSSKEDVRPISKALNTVFNGRGGGKPELCQGSLVGEISAIKEFMKIY
ncbi:alanyl-tRNA editing protein [Cellulosilyticum ruminicola]|uniref:alanyl-tRNA editing protein n=1 Tax=Cellulosilyticum ruminicola TaxID=425254 RepID=UPI0006D0F0A8|nr:alanine--tRNA ligase-related protein [Cellulosilyticum ruminicola]